jgi:hypothetical protein
VDLLIPGQADLHGAHFSRFSTSTTWVSMTVFSTTWSQPFSTIWVSTTVFPYLGLQEERTETSITASSIRDSFH